MLGRFARTSLCVIPLVSACSAVPGMQARNEHYVVEVHIASIDCETLQASAWQVGLTEEVWARGTVELSLNPAVGMDFVEQATGSRPATAPRLELGMTPDLGAPYLMLTSTDDTQPHTWVVAMDQRPEHIRYTRSGGWSRAADDPQKGHFLSLVIDNRSAIERAFNIGRDGYDASAAPSCISNL